MIWRSLNSFRDDKHDTKEKEFAPELSLCISFTLNFGFLGVVIVQCVWFPVSRG
jgi:hypothetical protein